MPQRAMITSLPEAMNIVKEMNLGEPAWDSADWRSEGRNALKEILEGRMGSVMDGYLHDIACLDVADRRNGSYSRYLLTELGGIELDIPRTRRYSAAGVIKAYSRRSQSVDRMILGCFFAWFIHPQGR